MYSAAARGARNRGGPPKAKSAPTFPGTLRKGAPRQTQQKPGPPEVPETLGTRAKTLLLVELYRSVPPTPPGTRADREPGFLGRAFYISEPPLRAWSG